MYWGDACGTPICHKGGLAPLERPGAGQLKRGRAVRAEQVLKLHGHPLNPGLDSVQETPPIDVDDESADAAGGPCRLVWRDPG